MKGGRLSSFQMYLLLIISLMSLLNGTNAMGDDTRLRMCPPGGSTFTLAWSMTCSMRRKKRDTSEDYTIRARRALVRPSLSQIKQICCDVGCTVQELLPYCSPFF